MTAPRRPAGIAGLAILFAAGTVMAGLAGFALLAAGGTLDLVWSLNPRDDASQGGVGPWGVALLFAIAIACAVVAVGLWRGARWGHRLAVALIAVKLVGDVVKAILVDPRGWIGVPVAGVVLALLLRPRIRSYFAGASDSEPAD